MKIDEHTNFEEMERIMKSVEESDFMFNDYGELVKKPIRETTDLPKDDTI